MKTSRGRISPTLFYVLCGIIIVLSMIVISQWGPHPAVVNPKVAVNPKNTVHQTVTVDTNAPVKTVVSVADQYFKDVQNKKVVPSTTAKKMYFNDNLKTFILATDAVEIYGCQPKNAPPEATAGIYTVALYTTSSNPATATSFYLSPYHQQDDFGNSWPVLYGPYQGNKQTILDSFNGIRCIDDKGGTTAIPVMR